MVRRGGTTKNGDRCRMLKTPRQPAQPGRPDDVFEESAPEPNVRSDPNLETELSVERDLRERAQRTAGLLWRLQSLTAAFTRASTTAEIADAVVDTGLAAMDAHSGALALLNDEGTELTIIRAAGYRSDVENEWRTFKVSDSLPLSEAVRKRELVLLDVTERNTRYPALADSATANRSFACVPLIVEDRVLGGLTYSFADWRSFTDDTRSFLLALGQLTAQALERARLYEAEHEALARAKAGAERLRLLAQASDALASSLEYGQTLQSVARSCVPHLADWCVVDLLDDEGIVQTLAVEHADEQKVAWARNLREKYAPDPESPTNAVLRVIRSGQPELYEDVADEALVEGAQDGEHLAILRELGMTSVMIVPMRPRDRVIGAITFVSTTESGRHYGSDDMNLAHEIAHRAAMAVENARLFRGVINAEADLRLQGALLRSQSEATLDGVLVTNLSGEVMSYNRRLLELFGFTEKEMVNGTNRPSPDAFASRVSNPDVYRARLDEFAIDPHRSGRDQIVFADGRVFDRWTAPLVDEEGELHGRAWYYREITAERRAEEALEDGQRRAAFLAEAGAALTSSMDYRVLLTALADVATEWFADWCAIDLVQRDQSIERVVIASRDQEKAVLAEEVDALRRYPSDPAASEGVRRVIESGQWDMRDKVEDAWLVREARGQEDYLAVLRSLDLRSHLCVPLEVGGRILGAITFVTTGDGRTFGPADLALAQELAFRAAAAVDHARLFEEHVHISRTLQRSLLPPHLPDIPGADVAARYHAAGEGYEVGGDFYDVFKTARGDWAIALGDVCGKGADAAATTALARHTLRAAAMQTRKPTRVLGLLNEAMLRAEQPFCTVVYARFQKVETGARLTVACGGHPLPVVLRADGAITTFGQPGTLLGAFAEPSVHEESLELHPGDAVVLYTDGVTEARNGTAVLGESGLRAALARSAGGSADDVADAIQEAALDFQDGDARDDIAIVVIKIRGS